MFLVNISKVIVALLLVLMCSSALSSFALYKFNGQCGDTRVALGPTYGKYGTADLPTNTIILDPVLTRSMSIRAVNFIFFHECGHIVKEHGPELRYLDVELRQENEADCYAADRFIKKYGEIQLKEVLHELLPLNGKMRNRAILACE